MEKLSFQEFIQKCSDLKVIISLDYEEGAELFDYQKECLNFMYENRFSVLKKDRQVGANTMAYLFMAYKVLYEDADIRIGFVGQSFSSARESIKWFNIIFQRIVDRMNLKRKVKYLKKNRTTIIIKIGRFEKTIDALTINGFPSNVRGRTYNYFIWDEVAYWDLGDFTDHNDDIWVTFTCGSSRMQIIAFSTTTHAGYEFGDTFFQYLINRDDFAKMYVFRKPYGCYKVK